MTEQVKIVFIKQLHIINCYYIIYFYCFVFLVRLDALQQGASQFEQQAGKLKRKFWLQNLKVCTRYTFHDAIEVKYE